MDAETRIIKREEITYELIFTKRKSVGISVNADGKVTVRAPYGVRKSVIRDIIQKKANWILEAQDKCWKNKEQKEEINYQTGRILYYLGKPYELQVYPSKSSQSRIVKKEHQIELWATSFENEYIRDCLEVYYRKEAKKILTEKVASFSAQMGVSYGRITIKNQRKRWGSCSSRGNLNFNWKVIMAPESIVDYLVIHELAHRKEMNHSKAFYSQVEKQFPDYKDAQKWLKEKGRSLVL